MDTRNASPVGRLSGGLRRILCLLLAVSLAVLTAPPRPALAVPSLVANAGPDTTVESGEMVMLEGAPTGAQLSYLWQQESGSAVVLSRPMSSSTSFFAPLVDVTTVLSFKLTVDDGVSMSEDSVLVRVTPRWDAGPQRISPSPYKRSSNPALGSSEGRVYTVWSEDGAAYFARRDVGEGTFGYPMSLSGLVGRRQANWVYAAPQIASSGATVCVAFEAYVAQDYGGRYLWATEAFLATSRDYGASFTVEMVSHPDDAFAARWPKVAIAQGHTYVVYQKESLAGGMSGTLPLQVCAIGGAPGSSKRWGDLGSTSAVDNSGFEIAAEQDRAGIVYADAGSGAVRLETWIDGAFVSNKAVSEPGQSAAQPHISSGGLGLLLVAWEEYRERPRPPSAPSGSSLPAREVWSAFVGAPDTVYAPENLSMSPDTDSSSAEITAFDGTFCVGWLEGNEESSLTRKLMVRSTGRVGVYDLIFAPATSIADVSGKSVSSAHPMRLSGSGRAAHAVWSSTGPSGNQDVYVAMSDDAGMTFSRQKMLSDSMADSFDPDVETVDGTYVSAWCGGLDWYLSMPRSEILTRAGGYTRDIKLLDLQVVQGPLGATSLVSGRKTVIRASVNNGNPTKQNVDVTYELKIERQDGTIETTSGVEHVELPAASTEQLYLPKDSFLKPARGSGEAVVGATVSISAADPNANTDSTNDATSTVPVALVRTKDFKFAVAPITLPGDPVRSGAQIDAFRIRAMEALKGFLPVAEDTLWGAYGRSVLTSATLNSGGAMSVIPSAPADPRLTARQEAMIDSDLAVSAAMNSVDISFGIVENSFFERRMADSAGTLGRAPYCVPPETRYPTALLRWKTASMGSVIPHEVMHTYGWVSGPADATGLAGDPLVAETGADPTGHMGLRAPGYWVEKRLEFSTTAQDLMHPVVSQGLPYWVSPLTWQYMLGRLKVPGDPAAVLISGLIDDADNVTLRSWYRMDSVLDLELGAAGDVSIRYLDGGGAEIARTAFTPSFKTSADGMATTTVVPFVLRIPDVPGTAKIVLSKGGATLAERQFSANTPVVKVLSPNGGETLTVDETATIQWDASDSDGGDLVATVQLSQDGGANWQTLAMDVSGGSLEFVPTKGDVAENAKVRVMVSDGVNTGIDASDATFTIRPKEVPRTGYAEPVLQPTLPALYGSVGSASGSGAKSLVVSGEHVYTLRRVDSHVDPGTGATVPYEVYVDASDDGGATFTPRHVAPLDDTYAASYGVQEFVGSGSDLIIAYGGSLCVTSHDGGVTWSDPFAPYSEPGTGVKVVKVLVSGPDIGVVVQTFPPGQTQIVFRASHDGGRTFDAPQTVCSATRGPYGDIWACAAAEGGRFNIVVYNQVPDTRTIPVSVKSVGLNVYTSLDGGRSFLSPTSIDTEDYIFGAQAVVDGDDLHLEYENIYARAAVKVVTSHDGGVTFDAPVTITSTKISTQAQLAADGGTVSVAWGTPGPVDPSGTRILVRSSQDGGDTFDVPVDVTQPYGLDNYAPNVPMGVEMSGNNVYVIWQGILSAGGGAHEILRVSTDSGKTFGECRDLCEAPHGSSNWQPNQRDFVAAGPNVYAFRGTYQPYTYPAWHQFTTYFRRGVGAVGGGIGVDAGDDQTIDEGGYAGVSATYSGAATSAPPTATIDWGDGVVTAGTVTDVNGDGTVTGAHGYSIVGTHTATVTVRDADGVTGGDTQQVVVVNLPPTVGPYPDSPPLPVVGQRFALSGFPFADAGVGETFSAAVDWGDGSSSPATVTVSPGAVAEGGVSGRVDAEHTYSVDGTFTVRVTVSDGDASGDATISLVAKQNHDPVADAGGPYVILEGSPVSLDASRSSDPDGDGLAFMWEVGGRTIGGLGSASPFADVVFADDYEGSIRLSVADGNGGTDETTVPLKVVNVPPYYFDVADRAVRIAKDAAIEATAAFMDAGRLDTHTASFEWGDGTRTAASVEETQGEGVASAPHVYSAAGTYTVTAAVTDDDGGSSETTFSVAVSFLNRPPIATDVSLTTTSGVPVAVHLSAVDPDGDTLTWLGTPVVAPANGALTGSPPDLTYTPNAGFVGTDIFAFRVSDGNGGSAVVNATIIVKADLAVAPAATVTRISGADRYHVALNSSRSTFPAGNVRRVVVASGERWDDPLVASGLAGTYRSPVLLVRRRSLPLGLVTELKRLGAKQVVVVGNSGSVSTVVTSKLRAAGFSISRVSGANRYEVARNVALRIQSVRGRGTVGAALVVRGDAFYDAMSVSALAYSLKMPVLYTPSKSLSPQTARAIRDLAVGEIIVAGGDQAVRPAVLTAIHRLRCVRIITRWGGRDRTATAFAVANGAVQRGWVSYRFVGATSLTSYADGLSASSTTGYRGGVLLPVIATSIPSGTEVLIKANRSEIMQLWLIARPSTASEAVLARLRALVE
jgi:putative cell wall-binding protein